jgi:hypothetical protein
MSLDLLIYLRGIVLVVSRIKKNWLRSHSFNQSLRIKTVIMSSPATSEDEAKPQPLKEDNTENLEKHLVGWEENDPANPRNWSTGYKRWITFQLGMVALAASLGSSIIAPAEPVIEQYVGVGTEVAVLCISLYM